MAGCSRRMLGRPGELRVIVAGASGHSDTGKGAFFMGGKSEFDALDEEHTEEAIAERLAAATAA